MTSAQHKRAMKILEKLMDKDPSRGSLAGRTLRLLAEIVEQYEKKRWPITKQERSSK